MYSDYDIMDVLGDAIANDDVSAGAVFLPFERLEVRGTEQPSGRLFIIIRTTDNRRFRITVEEL